MFYVLFSRATDCTAVAYEAICTSEAEVKKVIEEVEEKKGKMFRWHAIVGERNEIEIVRNFSVKLIRK